MRRTLRLALVVLGFAAAVYGVAALTGGWLGTPPWWDERVVVETSNPDGTALTHFRDFNVGRRPREGREWISGGVVVVGLGVAALGAWPRRRRPESKG